MKKYRPIRNYGFANLNGDGAKMCASCAGLEEIEESIPGIMDSTDRDTNPKNSDVVLDECLMNRTPSRESFRYSAFALDSKDSSGKTNSL